MGMRALLAGSAVLMAGVVACSSAGAATASPDAGGARRAAKVATSAAPTAKASTAAGSATLATVTEGLCTAPAARRALAAQLSADILKGLRGRNGLHAVSVYDRVTGVYCLYNGSQHFDSASIVKAIILGALLRWHQETGTPLSSWEKSEAALMITQSDNDAATDLWDEVGMTRLRQFLDAAKMD